MIASYSNLTVKLKTSYIKKRKPIIYSKPRASLIWNDLIQAKSKAPAMNLEQ